MHPIIRKVESDYMKEQIPSVEVGDYVEAHVQIKEGAKERIQRFEGIVIALKGSGVNQSVKIRKISFGIGVEKTIPLHCASLKNLIVKRKSKVRRAKLYYMRGLLGKKASRLKERK